MHEAGGGDDLIGGVAVKIQGFDRTADIECQRPSLQARPRGQTSTSRLLRDFSKFEPVVAIRRL